MKYLIGFALFMTALLFTLLVSGYAVDRFNITFAAEKTEPKIPVQSNEEFCIDYIQPRDPESPWYRDPDISAIKDERIVQLWEDIMITYRRNYPTGATVESIYCSKEYMAEPNTPERVYGKSHAPLASLRLMRLIIPRRTMASLLSVNCS